jgi:hypothetical protein
MRNNLYIFSATLDEVKRDPVIRIASNSEGSGYDSGWSIIFQWVVLGIGNDAAAAPAVSSRVNMSPYRPNSASSSGIGTSASKIAMRGGSAINVIMTEMLAMDETIISGTFSVMTCASFIRKFTTTGDVG